MIVTLEEAKKWVNIDESIGTDDDELLTSLIHSSEAGAESKMSRDLRARTYTAVFSTCDVRHPTYFYTTDRAASAVEAVYMWDASNSRTELGEGRADGDFAVMSGKDGELIVAVSSDTLSNYSLGSEAGDFMVIEFHTADASKSNLHGYHEIKRAILHDIAGGYAAREAVAQGASFSENPVPETIYRKYAKVLSSAGV